MYVYEAIATASSAARNCETSGNSEWRARWNERLDAIERDYLPSGSGFDNGTKINRDKSNAGAVVLSTSFHHMDDNGYYDGWTEHDVTFKPSFVGRYTITVSGRDRNTIKDYIAETFSSALDCAVEWSAL